MQISKIETYQKILKNIEQALVNNKASLVDISHKTLKEEALN